MPHAFGYRARTRDLFSRSYRKHGQNTPLSRLLTNYRMGDFVDIVADGSITKGMPHKYYYGKTGKVFNVTKHAVGIIVNKRVRGKILPKRINVRIEHIRKSQCREAFKERVRKNDALKMAAKKEGKKVYTKRIPQQPREERVIKSADTTTSFMNALKFRELY